MNSRIPLLFRPFLSVPLIASQLIVSQVFAAHAMAAEPDVLRVQDRGALFAQAAAKNQLGEARKTRPVLARPAVTGEIIVTVIAGEGTETRSKSAEAGDWVVQNQCPATGNEEILVKKEKFPLRYSALPAVAETGGYQPFAPRGEPMDYLVVTDAQPFAIIAPWGEKQRVMQGDILVRSQRDPQDSYRIQKNAFECTYQITVPAL